MDEEVSSFPIRGIVCPLFGTLFQIKGREFQIEGTVFQIEGRVFQIDLRNGISKLKEGTSFLIDESYEAKSSSKVAGFSFHFLAPQFQKVESSATFWQSAVEKWNFLPLFGNQMPKSGRNFQPLLSIRRRKVWKTVFVLREETDNIEKSKWNCFELKFRLLTVEIVIIFWTYSTR